MRRLLLIITLFLYTRIEPIALVFVHLGNSVPSYLCDALGQARLFNQHIPIFLVMNAHAFNERLSLSLDQLGIFVEFAENLPVSKEHAFFNKHSMLDNNYREGFWRKASERFFPIYELMEKHGLEDVIHIETDNMIYVDFQAILPALKKYPHIAAVFDNDDRCIPSVIYFAHQQAAQMLASFFAEHSAKGLNDMQIPALLKKTYGRAYLDNLPIIMPEYALAHNLVSDFGHRPANPSDYWNNIDEFNSIFDAAAFGQFLGGIDPRNGVSMPGFINESCIINPSKCIITWELDECQRKVPYISCKEKRYRINNLHIHSKNLARFAS